MLSHSLYWGIGNYLVLAHQVKFAEDIGYSSMFGASVFALFGIFMVIGQLSGFIADLIGREKTYTLTTVLSISALFALILVKGISQPWLLYIYAICLAMGLGFKRPPVLLVWQIYSMVGILVLYAAFCLQGRE